MASVGSMDGEKGGPTREAVRSEEEVDLIYETQSSVEREDPAVSGG